jgi:hypothetical protein
MKTTILLISSLLLFTGSILAQNGNFSYLDNDIRNDLNIKNNLSGFRQIDTTFKLIPNHDLFHKRNSQIFDFNPDMIIQHSLEINHSRRYAYAEEYPGSSIYYAKRPSLLQMPNEQYFIKKPDMTAKYYLIIIDPLSHTIIK